MNELLARANRARDNKLVKRLERITRESTSSLSRFERGTRESKLSEKIVMFKRFDSVNFRSRIEEKLASKAVGLNYS